MFKDKATKIIFLKNTMKQRHLFSYTRIAKIIEPQVKYINADLKLKYLRTIVTKREYIV